MPKRGGVLVLQITCCMLKCSAQVHTVGTARRTPLPSLQVQRQFYAIIGNFTTPQVHVMQVWSFGNSKIMNKFEWVCSIIVTSNFDNDHITYFKENSL